MRTLIDNAFDIAVADQELKSHQRVEESKGSSDGKNAQTKQVKAA